MHGWFGILELLVLLVFVLVVALAALAVRRRWLDRAGGTFECSLQRHADAGSGWSLGVGRYNAGVLEWFRFFSFSPRPREVFPRELVRVLETREPGAVEAVALNAEQRIIRVERRASDSEQEWELAMSPDSLTGLLSWLEAAPPGIRRLD